MGLTLITDDGKNRMLDRCYNTAPTYNAVTKYGIGINQATPTATDTDLTERVPISNGTLCDDGTNTLTGASGGSNTTSNTTVFKLSAGSIAEEAQNLIKTTTTTANPYWDLTLTTPFRSGGNYMGVWIYIKDATTLGKLFNLPSNDCIFISVGDDLANRYEHGREVTELSVGWNWIGTYPRVLSDDDTTYGTPSSGNFTYFRIQVRTNNVTDTFSAGELVYDILHDFTDANMLGDFITGYPVLTETENKIEVRSLLDTNQGNGFNLDGSGLFDSSNNIHSADKNTAYSKSSTGQVIYQWIDRII